jgi:hypothetical protein
VRIYVGQTRSAKLVRQLWRLGIGECTARGELPPRRHPYFYDNGAFKDWQAGLPFDEAQFMADVADIAGSGTRPDFIVLPDLVARGAESLKESIRWMPLLSGIAPLYLAVQDGMEPHDIAAVEVAGLFVGGTKQWKIATGKTWVDTAHARGIPCHIGRCGGVDRIRWAQRIGADSLDSCLPLWSDENLDRFLGAFKPTKQRALGLESAA